ncbi:NuA4 complex subunit EAF3-like protein [Morus notabilis]|uniref:NuA4 complex subunit EAF3-like protein n=1 Tax=Morus notabilis TaxID=981085 RepID=W9RP65_9ROSA|nr:NuA4 complex subunit EAF3-like protein [Morus notabilis]
MAISKTGTSHSSTTISNSTTEIDSEIHSFNHRGSPLLTDSTSFSVEDKVLASHRGVFYEAKSLFAICKVLKIQHDAKELKFFVHYLDNGAVFMEKLVNIQMPPTLKKQLNDDSVFVTNMGKLVKLPRTPNVHDIFNTYVDYREKKDGSFDDTIRPFVQSFEFYFDKALPAMLLYQCERRQFEEATTDDISPSTVYGAEHLLRLFDIFACHLFELELQISVLSHH